MQIERPERTQDPEAKDKSVERGQLSSGTLNALQRADQEEDQMNTIKRPVAGIQNDPMQEQRDPKENSPGLIVDIKA